MTSLQTKNISVFLFFLFFAILGVLIFRDYGISTDEVVARLSGIVSLNYLAELFHMPITDYYGNIRPLDEFFDKDYGVIFELTMTFIEYIFSIKDSQHIYYLRHFFTYAIFLFGAFSIYEMSERRFKNWKIGLFSALILILSPRIFADSFYNNKDIVFMSLLLIATNYNIKFLLDPGKKSLFFAAFFSAFAIDVRIMGIIVPAVTFSAFIIESIKQPTYIKKNYLYLLFYTVFLILFTILLWPWLWSDPLNFFVGFDTMAHFIRWNGYVLFAGDFILGSNLPWYYAPVWIAITTPIIYLLLFLAGSASIFYQIIVNHYRLWKESSQIQDYIFFALFYGPLLAVIIFHSILYNGWRQLYFVYPAFILIATHGVVIIWNMGIKSVKYVRVALVLVIIASLTQTVHFMWSIHPLQNVYFSPLAGKNLNAKWPIDYWGLSHRKALEYILDNDTRENIAVNHATGWTNLNIAFRIIDRKNRKRLSCSKGRMNADYLISNIRGVKDNDALEEELASNFSEYHTIHYGDEPILKIYKSKNQHTLNTKPLQNFSFSFKFLSVESSNKVFGWKKGRTMISIELENTGNEIWHSAYRGRHRLAIAYRLENKYKSIKKYWLGLPKDMHPGEKIVMKIPIWDLSEGKNAIIMSMIQRSVAWLPDKDNKSLKVRLLLNEGNYSAKEIK